MCSTFNVFIGWWVVRMKEKHQNDVLRGNVKMDAKWMKIKNNFSIGYDVHNICKELLKMCYIFLIGKRL